MEEFKSEEEKQGLRMKLLEKLIRDEIQVRKRENLEKYRSLQEILEETVAKYRQNSITAAAVMKQLVEMRKEYFAEDERKQEYNLSNEEIAFLDAITEVRNTQIRIFWTRARFRFQNEPLHDPQNVQKPTSAATEAGSEDSSERSSVGGI